MTGTLDDRYAEVDGTVFLTGMQALTRVLVDQIRHDNAAGLRTAGFVSGYPGSPLGGFDLELARRRELLAAHGIVHRPGVNEELAATAVAGSQLAHTRGAEFTVDGVVGAWYGKAPGLDRSLDALRHAAMAGSDPRGGALAFVGDDPAAKSSTLPSSSASALASLGMAVLYPADQQELLDYGRHAVELSRCSGLWAALKIVADVADGSSTVHVGLQRFTVRQPDTVIDGQPFRHTATGFLLPPASGRLEATLHHERPLIAARYAAVNHLDQITVRTSADRVGIVTSGKTYLDVRQALATIGLDAAECRRAGVRVLKLAMIHPIEPTVVKDFAAGLSAILVVEEKRGFIEAGVKNVLYGSVGAPPVHGKTDADGRTLVPSAGILDVGGLTAILARYLAGRFGITAAQTWIDRDRPRSRLTLPVVTRTPFVCSGCPHSSSMPTPHGTFVGTGTGCGCLTALQRPDIGDGGLLMQMGGEGAQWIGMAPFLTRDHLTQNLGDGTFHHSGQLAVRAAVAAGVDMTYKILYNSAVAMTGGQHAPGVLAVPELVGMLLAEGVTRVIVTTDEPAKYRRVRLPRAARVFDRTRVVEAQEILARERGVTVLIHDQECATEKRRARKRGLVAEPTGRVMINERVCEGCGDCGSVSNCLSVQPVDTEYGRKTRIHQASCNKDFSCLRGDCPAFLRVTPAGRPDRRKRPDLAAAQLPAPVPRPVDRPFSMRITGIGGSGVVTVAQILANAGAIAGVTVHGMDQTGLAQKGGAVVSDLKFGPVAVSPAPRVAPAECDLYLGCELLVAADPTNLATIDPGRTVAVVSTSEVPTAAMITDPSAPPAPFGEAVDAITSLCTAARSTLVDARLLSSRLFGDDQYANVLLVGAAYQRGALPIPDTAIEQAITLNGAAAATNIQAFRRGRQLVSDPDGLAIPSAPTAQDRLAPDVATITDSIGADPGSQLHALLGRRVADLIAYQNAEYARRFADVLRRTVDAERALGGTALAEATAFGLHKLMAYKDEYEVARLHLDPGVAATVRREFGAGATFSWLLHPPVLRALGRTDKIAFGRGTRPVLRVLSALRRLRGTPLDVFGYTRVRRVERRLVADYIAGIHHVLDGLSAPTHEIATRLAWLPDAVRGYEHVKLRNVAEYEARRAQLLAEFDRLCRADALGASS